MPRSRLPSLVRRRVATLTALVFLLAPTRARAEATAVEVSPWTGWAAGAAWNRGESSGRFLFNLGIDATTRVVTFPTWLRGSNGELRLGPWAEFSLPLDIRPFAEGGLSVVGTQVTHASWGTYGLRIGAGGGPDVGNHLVVTAWGGVRYVPARSEAGPSGTFSKVTGLRIIGTYRAGVGAGEAGSLLFGVEFEPDYVLPPFSIEKWIGVH